MHESKRACTLLGVTRRSVAREFREGHSDALAPEPQCTRNPNSLTIPLTPDPFLSCIRIDFQAIPEHREHSPPLADDCRSTKAFTEDSPASRPELSPFDSLLSKVSVQSDKFIQASALPFELRRATTGIDDPGVLQAKRRAMFQPGLRLDIATLRFATRSVLSRTKRLSTSRTLKLY